MTDYSRDRLGPDDDDRLPWLEPVEEEIEEGGIATGRLILWVTAALVVVGLIIGGVLWMRSGDKAASGDGALIKAPDSYYKERPADEAAAADDDQIVYSASKGNEVESVIDTSGTAETPVNVDHPQVAEAAPPPPAPVAAKAAPTASAPAPVKAPKPVAAKPMIDEALAKQATKAPAKPAPAKPALAKATPVPVAAPASQMEMKTPDLYLFVFFGVKERL